MMLSNKTRISRLLSIAFLLITFLLAAQVHAGISIVVTQPPPLREVLVEPMGYTRCYVIPQGFYRGVWHYRHRVCEYEEEDALRVWVAGYWQCVSFLPNGRCTGTAWIRNHWAGPRDREYRPFFRGPGSYQHRPQTYAEEPRSVHVPGRRGGRLYEQVPVHRPSSGGVVEEHHQGGVRHEPRR